MRGGLDDALDKLARRDELRRRAAGEASGTPPAVTELVEAIAAVVARRPELAITMGVEGAGDPVLLHFAVDNGVVQVRADNTVAERAEEAVSPAARHADFDIDPEPMDEVFSAQATQHRYDPAPDMGADGPATGGSGAGPRPYRYDAARQYETTGSYDPDPYDQEAFEPGPDEAEAYDPQAYEPVRYAADSYDRGAEASRTAEQPRYTTPVHPTPVHPAPNRQDQGHPARARTMPAQPAPRAMPTPLPEPIPLRMEPGETEVAAKRLAALLREDPSLLHPAPRD